MRAHACVGMCAHTFASVSVFVLAFVCVVGVFRLRVSVRMQLYIWRALPQACVCVASFVSQPVLDQSTYDARVHLRAGINCGRHVLMVARSVEA